MFLQNGIEYLKRRLYENASTKIVITRGGKSLGEFDAILAKTKFYDVDGTDKRVISFVSDFIVRGDSGYSPKNNDRIFYDNRYFVVRPFNKEVWKYDDPYKIMIRVHAREEAQL